MDRFEEFRDLLKSDRTFRRFDGERLLDYEQLKNLVELTRYCASGRNLQPLKYRIVTEPKECESIFPALKWAGYLNDWDGPSAGERPVAYLVQCLDTSLTQNLLCDDGLQLQAITLGAKAMGIGCCIIKSFNVESIKRELHIPDDMKPLYVVALGYPVEIVKIEDITCDGDIKYWRDTDGVHHVPKRVIEDLII